MKLRAEPTWAMFVAVLAAVFVLAVIGTVAMLGISGSVDKVGTDITSGRERGYRTRAVGCMSLIIDNDRTFDLTPDCTIPEVAAWYPPQVCQMLALDPRCGVGLAKEKLHEADQANP